jgi:hypothetical protein
MLGLDRHDRVRYRFRDARVHEETHAISIDDLFALEGSLGQLHLDVETATEAVGAAQAHSSAPGGIDAAEFEGASQHLCGLPCHLNAHRASIVIR